MSIRRQNVIKTYADIIGDMYGDDHSAPTSGHNYDGAHRGKEEENVAA